MSLVAFLGAAWIQHVRPELPAEYTWLQPYRVLRRIAETEDFPTAVLFAFGLGAFARVGVRGLAAQIEAVRARDFGPADRKRWLVRMLAFVVVVALDVLFIPTHGPLDAVCLGLAGASLARPWSRAALLRWLGHGVAALLVFTAVCYWFTVIKALTFVGRTQHDADIVNFEHALTGVYPHQVLARWSSERPGIVYWFDWAYFKIFDHMTLTTAFLLGLRNVRERTAYLGALAICYFLGGPLYLVYPAAGPVYFDPAQFQFLHYQELIVNYVQAGLYQNTAAINSKQADILDTWSYIACLPSLHMAHESVMLFYARASRIGFALSLAFTLFTGVAVVALGWHYPSDIVAGVALAAVAIVVARWQANRLLPAQIVPQGDS
ncbi:MAG: phosphatase PAP2 family protein [Polyangiaceae bacterium]